MASYPKWVIKYDEIIMGVVEFHCDLCKDKSGIIGGGWYYKDSKNKNLYLYGKSQDFGQCTIDEVRRSVPNSLFTLMYDGYSLFFSTSEDARTAISSNELVCIIKDI